MSDTLCPAVWDHLCINTMGKNRLCCNAVTQDKELGRYDYIEKLSQENWKELVSKRQVVSINKNHVTKMGNTGLNKKESVKCLDPDYIVCMLLKFKKELQKQLGSCIDKMPIIVRHRDSSYDIVSGNTRLNGISITDEVEVWYIDVTKLDTFVEDFNQHWNELRNNVKKEMLAGNRPDICKSCWKKEESGMSSLRTQKIETYKNQGIWNNFLNTINIKKNYPVELDLKLGNYCNLSCRMCSSYSSSGVANEFQKILKETGVDLGLDEYEKTFVQNKWYLKDQFVNLIQNMIANGLRYLKFTGGEPLMVPSVKKIINYCVENNYAKDIELVIITNVTLIDDKWIKQFKAFQFVNIICSIDGIGNTFEYIRHPGNWNNVNSKLQKLYDAQSSNLIISVTFTLQIYNILEIRNLVELSQKYMFHLSLIPLDKPAYLDVCNAPQSLKNTALKMIESLEHELTLENTPRTENNCLCFHDSKSKDIPCLYTCPHVVTNVLNRFVSNIKKKILQPQQKDLDDEFLKVTKIKDTYKNQNFNTLEISKYYDSI